MNDLAQIQTIDDYFREFCERPAQPYPPRRGDAGLMATPARRYVA